MTKVEEPSDLVTCSFCGKSQNRVGKLIAGPGVYICNDCVELCNDIMREEAISSALATPPPLPERGVSGLLAQAIGARGRLENQLGRRPTIGELAVDLGVNEQELTKVLRQAVPLDDPHVD